MEVAAGMFFGLRVWSFPVEPDKDKAILRDFHTANTDGTSEVTTPREAQQGTQAQGPPRMWHDVAPAPVPMAPIIYCLCALAPVVFSSWVPLGPTVPTGPNPSRMPPP